MPTTRHSKHMKKKKPVCNKFERALEKTREQTDLFWESLALPKHRATNRKPKTIIKGSHNTIKNSLKAKAYRQAEERDEGTCIICKMQAHEHHHIIKQSTRFRPEYIQRMENVACVCVLCHTEIHRPKRDKNERQAYLEEWQRKYYPEYSAMMKELAKVTGCRDQWLIDRWNNKNLVEVM